MRRSSLPTSSLLIPSMPSKPAGGATGAKKKSGRALAVNEAAAKMAVVKSSAKKAASGKRASAAMSPVSTSAVTGPAPEDQAAEIMILRGEYWVWRLVPAN